MTPPGDPLLIDHVIIAPITRANNKFDADRVDVTWRL